MSITTTESGGACFAPGLGVGFEGRPVELLRAVAPLVDTIEIVPDCLVGPGGAVTPSLLAAVDEYAAHVAVTYHGIGLSIGSTGGWKEDYLRLLDTMMGWRLPRWHSEHLGFTMVEGSFLGTMPALPATERAAEMVIERSRRLRAAYGLEVMLEHVATPLPRPDSLRLAEFLNLIARESGSRLLIDLHNLECDVDNGLLDLDEFVGELDWTCVGELHVAGGVWRDGIHLDVHSGPVGSSTLALLERVLPRATACELVVFELLAAAVPQLGVDAVVAQLGAVRDVLTRERVAS